MTCGGRTIRDENIHCKGLKRWLRWLHSPAGVGLLLLGLVFFHLIGHHLVRGWLGHIYTPPALSPEKAALYSRFVKLIQAHPQYKRVHLDMYRGRWLEKDDSVVEQGDSSNAVIDDEMIRISRGFKQVGCLRADKYSSYVAFMPKPNYILPTSPGVLYSLDGRNPNDVDDKYLNSKRPFMQIKGCWYTSRGLAVSPLPMTAGDWSLPKWSLIDRSLQDPGLVPGEGN